jgi:hypothetical protein
LLCCHIFFFGSSQLILWFSRTGHLIYITFLVRPALISYNHLKVASGLKHNPLMIFWIASLWKLKMKAQGRHIYGL